MLIKALVSFAGAECMNKGEVREVDDKFASSLISCGYAEAAGDPQSDRGGDADENIGDNSRKRKKSAKD